MVVDFSTWYSAAQMRRHLTRGPRRNLRSIRKYERDRENFHFEGGGKPPSVFSRIKSFFRRGFSGKGN